MKQTVHLLLLILFYSTAHSQGETNIWYFGATAGVDFNGGAPVALTNGVLSTSEGCATICDKNGSLLFYTDGIRVWNRNHTQMPNGTGLLGDPSSAQSAIIVPKPGSTTSFYVFTVAAQGNAGGFCYSEVDLTLNGGLGDVIPATKNTQLFTPSLEKCTAVKHANGLYVWVLAHGFNNNRYYAYLVDCSGVNTPVISDVGSVEGWPGWGYLTASPNGQKIATAMRAVGFELLDFNNSTGAVSNPVFLGNAGECYGISFSPDNNVLYGLKINAGAVLQWDLQAGNQAAIQASMQQVGTALGTGNYRGGAMQIGPDGKLYIVQFQQPFLSVINNPNTLGLGCNMQTGAVDLQGRNAVLGLPPFIQSYFDTTDLFSYNGYCAGYPTQFTISGNTAGFDSVRWYFDDPASGPLNTSNQLSPTHTYASGGTYQVQLIRYLSCIADTTILPVVIQNNSATQQQITICPGSTFTRPGGAVATIAGTYTDTLTAANGCDSVVTTSLSFGNVSVDAGANASICNGQSTTLNASGGLIYSWSPTTNLSNPNIANPIATPSTTTTYTVTSQIPIDNVIVNGNFNGGNTGFSSGYNYTTPPNTTEGQYWVSTNAATWNGGMASCGDHTTGSGNMLIVNGATTPNVSIWCQTVSVLPNTDYAFSTWLMTLSAGNPAQLQFSINGNLLGSVFVAPNGTCVWQQFYTTWNSGSNTTANICIVNQNTIASANDFAIDDIEFSPLCTATDSVTITVHPVYSNTVNAFICQGETYTLPGGGTANSSGTYVDSLLTVNGCDSIIATQLTVYPTYSASVAQTICPSDMYILPSGNMVNTTGTYIDTLTTVNGCDSIITTQLTVVPPSINVSNDTAVCLGNAVQLNASGGLYTYTWTPATGLSSDTIANPVATPTQTTTYVVTTQVASADLIANGDFSGGNTGFSSGYTNQTDLTPAGTYYVGSNPNTYHSGFNACTDHTGGTGNMMIVNGAGTPGTNVWCQTINVVPNTNYAFSAWVNSVVAGSPAILQFSINGSLLSTPFNAPATACQWQQFYAIWNSGNSTTANICIVNQNTTTGGNDFALDDISFIGLCTASDSVTITVNNPSLTVIDTAICDGVTYTFPLGNTATATTVDTALLTDVFGCDSVVITNLTVNLVHSFTVNDTICADAIYTLPDGTTSVSATGTYTTILQNSFGCDSTIITNLVVNPVSATTYNDTICYGSTYTLADGSPVSATGSYAVTLSNVFGCDSVVTVQLTVLQPALTTTHTNLLCYADNTGTITGSALGGLPPYSYSLYRASTALANNTNGSFSGLQADVYVLIATDSYGCADTGSITITEPGLLVSSALPTPATCFGENDGELIINATDGTSPYTYSVSGEGSANNGTFSNLSAGNYTYTVTDANNCTDTGLAIITQPNDVLITITPDSLTLQLGEGAQVSTSTNYNNATYLWSPVVGLSCTDCPNPQVAVNSSLVYNLTVSVAVNGNNCEAVAQLPVTVIPDYSLYIPNVFTPNQDGNNDYFSIFGNLPALKYIEVKIFNRSGEKVFQSNDINFAWDGTYLGKPLPPQVLVYTVYAGFIDGHAEKVFKGSLTLVK